jgi:predicted nucleic acid-binding protein
MLVDSNILVYAINSDSPKYRRAVSFLQSYKSSLVFAHQNIIEAIKVLTERKYSHPISSALAANAVLSITNACKVISPNDMTFFLVLEYITKHQPIGNRIFDAYLAATALSNGIHQIATDNVKDFQGFREIKLLNPFTD